MSFNNELASLAVIVLSLVFFYAILVLQKPRRIAIKVYKHPDGTYKLKYSWGWHLFDSYQIEQLPNIEFVEDRVKEILEKTEWKKE